MFSSFAVWLESIIIRDNFMMGIDYYEGQLTYHIVLAIY